MVRGIGLRNIHARLQRMYGRGLHISSRENEGTEIVFAIPVRELLRRPKQGFAQEAKTRECLVFAIPGFLFG